MGDRTPAWRAGFLGPATRQHGKRASGDQGQDEWGDSACGAGWKRGQPIVWRVFHAFGRFRFALRIGAATADFPLCRDIQSCGFVFALLELPNSTRIAMAFKVNVVSRRNRAAIASF